MSKQRRREKKAERRERKERRADRWIFALSAVAVPVVVALISALLPPRSEY